MECYGLFLDIVGVIGEYEEYSWSASVNNACALFNKEIGTEVTYKSLV